VRPRIADRVASELADHWAEVRRELEGLGLRGSLLDQAISARIGSIDRIVEAVSADPDALVLGRRLPWVVFGAGPVLAAVFVFTALSAAGLFEGWSGRAIPGDPPALVAWTLASGLFCALARRHRCDARWPALSAGLLALVGGVVFAGFRPPTGADPGLVFVGLSPAGAGLRASCALVPFGLDLLLRRLESRLSRGRTQ
jgi:hypothetical protein